MRPTRRDLAALTLAIPMAWGPDQPAFAADTQGLVIACGGGSAEIPACSQAAYERAIREGADFIAAAFVPCKDGTLVAMPGDDLSASTDVATRSEFADRRQRRRIDDEERTGWFAEDFSLAELKTLNLGSPSDGRARGRAGRTGHAILTFEEMVSIARAGCVRTARVIGVHATMIHPSYFGGLDLAVEPRLANAIRVAGYNSPAAAMLVACRDVDALKTFGELTRARRVLRVESDAAWALTMEALKSDQTIAAALAVDVSVLLDLSKAKTTPPTHLIGVAHTAGLAVHAWTASGTFPPPPFRPPDGRRLLVALFAAGVDAVAGDFAAPIAQARKEAMSLRRG